MFPIPNNRLTGGGFSRIWTQEEDPGELDDIGHFNRSRKGFIRLHFAHLHADLIGLRDSNCFTIIQLLFVLTKYGEGVSGEEFQSDTS